MTICRCARTMTANGTRTARVTDWQHGRFVTIAAEIRRFRCRHCGSTTSVVSPELENGFRLSRSAAEMIVERALEGRDYHEAPVDAATVSRLLSARKAALLERIPRPRFARLEIVQSAGVVVSDALTHEISTVFSNFEDKALIPWLSSPYPSVLVPDIQVAPRLLRHATDFVVALPVRVLAESLKPLLERAEARLQSLTARAREAASLSVAHARHFGRMRSQLLEALDSTDTMSGKAAIQRWAAACQGSWADVFAPVLRFLHAFSATIFSHSTCIVPPPPHDRFRLAGPTNVLALRIERDRVLRPRTPGGERMALGFK